MSTATAARPSTHASRRPADGSLQLVSFRLASEEYGVEIRNVREIILLGEITQLPELPPYVKGVIHLRDTMIPIVDLKLKFGFAASPPTDDTRIMVIHVQDRVLGIIVDEVNEVLRISPNQIAPPPPAITQGGESYLMGLARLDDRLMILLDIERVLTEQQVRELPLG